MLILTNTAIDIKELNKEKIDKMIELNQKILKEEENINDKVAALLITEVDYKSSKLHNVKRLTKISHKHGVLVVCDLAHSTGAILVNVKDTNVDFAIGCTYKYLNGGPGSPAFIYVSKRHLANVIPGLWGWHGHKSPFDFNLNYQASLGIDRMRIGTPSILSLMPSISNISAVLFCSNSFSDANSTN